MVTFDTNVLVYATTAAPDAKAKRSRDLIVRGMQSGWSILLLQTLAEFSSVAIRKAGIPIDDIRATIDAWRAVLPVQAAEDGDLAAALDAVKAHRLAFLECDAVGCGATCGRAALAHREPAGRFRAAGRQIRQPIRTSERSIDRRNSSAIVIEPVCVRADHPAATEAGGGPSSLTCCQRALLRCVGQSRC